MTFANVSGTETTCTLSGGSLLTELEAEDEQKRFEARSQTSVGPTEDPNCGASSTKVEVSYADPYGNRRRGSAFAGNGNIATWESDAVGAGTYTAVHEVDFSRCNHLLAQDCTFQVTTTLSPK